MCILLRGCCFIEDAFMVLLLTIPCVSSGFNSRRLGDAGNAIVYLYNSGHNDVLYVGAAGVQGGADILRLFVVLQ